MPKTLLAFPLCTVVAAAGFLTMRFPADHAAHAEPPAFAAPARSFLKAAGTDVRDDSGKGEIVALRGVNLGSWLLLEDWMCPLDASGLKDDFSAREMLTSCRRRRKRRTPGGL